VYHETLIFSSATPQTFVHATDVQNIMFAHQEIICHTVCSVCMVSFAYNFIEHGSHDELLKAKERYYSLNKN